MTDAIERATRIIAAEAAHWTDPEDGIRQGLEKAIDAGLLSVTRCTCPVGFGQVRDPKCPMHGNRSPAHTITGAAA